MDTKVIGKVIAQKRKEMHMTQEVLSQKLNVTAKTISHWENGYTLPDISMLIPLSNILGITVYELLSGELDYRDTMNAVVNQEQEPNVMLEAEQRDKELAMTVKYAENNIEELKSGFKRWKIIFILTAIITVLLVYFFSLSGCQKQIAPDMKPPKGGYIEYWYDEGGEMYYGGSTPMKGPFSKPQKDLEEKCNFYAIIVKDKDGNVVRNISKSNIQDEWHVEENTVDGGRKHTSYDGEMNFISCEINYINAQGRLIKSIHLNEDDSLAAAEIIEYLEDGTTHYRVFFYDGKGELAGWSEYLPPLYEEFVERDANEAPEEYLKLK